LAKSQRYELCSDKCRKAQALQNKREFDERGLEKIQTVFADFKKESLQRKKAVKAGTASPKEFTDWLYQQSNVIVELTEY
jgi:inorganic pyrophosphatase